VKDELKIGVHVNADYCHNHTCTQPIPRTALPASVNINIDMKRGVGEKLASGVRTSRDSLVNRTCSPASLTHIITHWHHHSRASLTGTTHWYHRSRALLTSITHWHHHSRASITSILDLSRAHLPANLRSHVRSTPFGFCSKKLSHGTVRNFLTALITSHIAQACAKHLETQK